MLLDNYKFEEIDENIINLLKENQINEYKTIEYKSQLPEFTDKGTKEYLADVSSFANASGGYIAYGITEEKGIPVEIKGIEIEDADALILKLENIILYGIYYLVWFFMY